MVILQYFFSTVHVHRNILIPLNLCKDVNKAISTVCDYTPHITSPISKNIIIHTRITPHHIIINYY